MNNRSGFVITLLVVFFMSCTSRPAVSRSAVSPPPAAVGHIDAFEQAVQIVKMNSPLIRKYFAPREEAVIGYSYASVDDIVIKGEYRADGNEYLVSYDLTSAFEEAALQASGLQANGLTLRVSFRLEDTKTGVSRDDVLLWSPAAVAMGNVSGLLLSLDDNYWDIWRQYFDLFDSYNAKVTFFVQGSMAEIHQANSLADFCAEVTRRGHSLGFHTINHYDLRKVSPEVFESETTGAAAAFLREGISFSAFAYPFGFSEPWMRETLAAFFPFTRGYGTNIRLYDTETNNNGYMVSKAIDNIVFPDDAKFESDIRRILLAAKFAGNCIVPFTTHDISDEAQWGIEVRRLEYLLRTAQELKLKFYTYSDIRHLFPGLRDW